MNFLHRLLPRRDYHWLLGRSLVDLPTDFEVEGVEAIDVLGQDSPDFALLDSFASLNGFPGGWALDMLADGARALLLCDTQQRGALAMGWTIQKPFHIEEIHATLDPGEGIYLFGDFVVPAARGRKLQRLLVAERLARATSITYACTVIHPSNIPSMRSYQSQGFVPAARWREYHWFGRDWTRCQPSGQPADVRFTPQGQGRLLAQSI